MGKRRQEGSRTQQAIVESLEGRPSLPKYMAYALPGRPANGEPNIVQLADGFDLYDLPLGSHSSFLDFSGVILFGGAFEKFEYYRGDRMLVCIDSGDLDRRETELWTAIDDQKTVVFLVPTLASDGHYVSGERPRHDLLKRFLYRLGIGWSRLEEPVIPLTCTVPEFCNYMKRHGAGYVTYGHRKEQKEYAKEIALGDRFVYGAILGGKIFLLPAVSPRTHDQAIKMAIAALEAAIAYRERVSEALPDWVRHFHCSRESALRTEAEEVRSQLMRIDSRIEAYDGFRGALCQSADPLVDSVTRILKKFFGLELEVDDKCIEDATLKDDEDNTLAVFEIKGRTGNFIRKNVNQVDDHRERLGLSPDTPGVLIMNTIMSADSVEKKDHPPHPDIIKKAVQDNVLLVRTLDLLRYADLVERKILERDNLRKTMLSEAGWLKVEGDTAAVMKQ